MPAPASGATKGLLSSASSVGASRAMSYKSQVITMRRSCGTGTPSGLLDKHTSCARSISRFSRQKRTAGKLAEIGHLLLDCLA